MSRFAVVFALGLCAALAPAAPVPRPVAEKERIAALWGETAGAGEFDFQGRQVTIRSAPVVPDLLARGPSSIPHTGRKVCGDFVATVKLIESTGPCPGAPGGCMGAAHVGLYISGDGHGATFHRTELFSDEANGKRRTNDHQVYVADWYPDWGRVKGIGQKTDGAAIYLRITRCDRQLTGTHSSDGKSWAAPYTMADDHEFTCEVTVGVFAGCSVPHSVTATFADLTIEPLKPEPKK